MDHQTETIAHEIFQAYQSKQPIPFIRHRYNLTEEEAYAVQDALIALLTAHEEQQIAGYKISMTSKETQAIANTHEPAYGTILSKSLLQSGDHLPLDSCFAPLIEPEILFLATEDFSPHADAVEILAKTKICAGIEIPDARYENWFPNFSLMDLLADNTATGFVVLSEPIESLPFTAFSEIDMALFYEDEKIHEGVSSAVLGNPVTAVEWLVQKLNQHGKTVKKGMVISSGTFISPIPAQKGSYRITYKGVGQVSVTFT